MGGVDLDELPLHRQLNVLYRMLYLSMDEDDRDDLDRRLSEPPPEVVAAQAARQRRAAVRKPKDWGDGDDDEIEMNAGLGALAVMRSLGAGRPS